MKFSNRSLEKILTCHPDLQRVLHTAMSYQIMDFSVICGERTTEEQKKAYADGHSKLDGVTKFSKHQTGGDTGRDVSDAFDIVPYPLDWDDTESFCKLASVIFKAAAECDVQLKWGGHWKSFKDYPHFER